MPADTLGRISNPTDPLSTHCCKAFLISIHRFESRNEIINASELAVNGCEADIGHFTDVLELIQHKLADLGTADFAGAALLELKFNGLDHFFKTRGVQPRLLTGTIQAMQQLAAVEDLAVAIAFDHCDWNCFNPFVGREAALTVQAFPPASNAAPSICCSRLENTTIGVLAGGALHAHIFSKFTNFRQ